VTWYPAEWWKLTFATAAAIMATCLTCATTAQAQISEPQAAGPPSVDPQVFLQSVVNGDLASVRAMIEAGADVNSRDPSGYSALMYASRHGHLEIVRLLLARSAEVNAADKAGRSALREAAGMGHAQIVALLVAANANVNLADDNRITPLLLSSYHGHTDIVRRLIEAGADCATRDAWGNTAVILAAKNGRTEALDTLLKAGSDINARDRQNITALTWASLAGHAPAMRLLLEHGAIGLYFEGGDGSSLENAIIIRGAASHLEGVAAESLWVGKHYPQWKQIMQALVQQDAKRFDVITYSTPKGPWSLFFDISDFWGKGFKDLTQ
jgi:ankyrin repeat protein